MTQVRKTNRKAGWKWLVLCLVWVTFFTGLSLPCLASDASPEVTPYATPIATEGNPSDFPWGIAFALTSLVSLVIAVALAIRAGNKKYGKNVW